MHQGGQVTVVLLLFCTNCDKHQIYIYIFYYCKLNSYRLKEITLVQRLKYL